MHERLLDRINDELEKIADKGLTASNVETAYKLVDMYKDLVECDGGYSGTDEDSSYGRHYVRGHYSRDDDKYSRMMRSKNSYRSSGSSESRRTYMTDLKEWVGDTVEKLEDMISDADTMEERQTIQRYISTIKSL